MEPGRVTTGLGLKRSGGGVAGIFWAIAEMPARIGPKKAGPNNRFLSMEDLAGSKLFSLDLAAEWDAVIRVKT